MATRRPRKDVVDTDVNNDITMANPTSNRDTSTLNSTSSSLLTKAEIILLSLYPLTLVLGSLYSTLAVSPIDYPYNPLTQSHDATRPPSYFARKNNIFNHYFVKVGWFWTSLALILLHALPFSLSTSSTGQVQTVSPTPISKIRALVRYLIATLAWTIVTQWFFGPPLIDRGFVLSGGRCDVGTAVEDTLAGQSKAFNLAESGKLGNKDQPGASVGIYSNYKCKSVGGVWTGGHDISGHVFILILGSGLLAMECLPVLIKKYQNGGGVLGLEVKLALGIAGLKWWMLLMTSTYFHTWFEKFTGLLAALIVLGSMYILPRKIPALGEVMGRPNI